MTDPQWIASDRPDEIADILRDLRLMEAGESIGSVAPAGDGNMNLTLRVALTSGRSLIVKQARPWVEKYPSIEAPVDRMHAESRFYEMTGGVPELASAMPRFLAACPDRYVLCLEDLGGHADLSSVYQGGVDLIALQHHVRELGDWLAHLHRLSIEPRDAPKLRNTALRRLNHQHIFVIPFAEESDLGLDQVIEGLDAVSRRVRSNTVVRERAGELGEVYLGDGPCLLHGDFFPGSWLATPAGVRVIDPEFSHCGRPEFDVAVTLAHLQIAGCDGSVNRAFTEAYAADGARLDSTLVDGFAAVEVLRRLLGVAQLPLRHSLERIQRLVDDAIATLG